MSFIGQTADSILGRAAELKFQVVVFGRDAVYFEGVKPLKLDGDEMIFRARSCVITLVGEGLTVKELADDCVSVLGKINGFTVNDL